MSHEAGFTDAEAFPSCTQYSLCYHTAQSHRHMFDVFAFVGRLFLKSTLTCLPARPAVKKCKQSKVLSNHKRNLDKWKMIQIPLNEFHTSDFIVRNGKMEKNSLHLPFCHKLLLNCHITT